MNSILSISDTISILKGVIESDTTNYLSILDNAKISGGSDSAYVSGNILKTGNDAFEFPLGDRTLGVGAYHPLLISAPGSTTDAFLAGYGAVAADTITSVDTLKLSQCESWTLKHVNGSSPVILTLGWNSNSCEIDDQANLWVAGRHSSTWTNYTKSSFTQSGATGRLVSNGYINLTTGLPYVFTIGNLLRHDYAVLKTKLDGGYFKCISSKLYFQFTGEYNTSILDLHIYEDSRTELTLCVPANALQKNYGDNRYVLNFASCGAMIPGKYYVMEVLDEKKYKYYLRFCYN